MPDSLERIANLSPEKRELLLAWLRDQRPSAPEAASLPLLTPHPEARWEPFPLTPVQETYWAGRSGLYELWGGTNIYQEFAVRGPFEPVMARLNHAVRRLIGHHDMLRAVLQPHPGGILQRVLPEVPPYDIKVVDLRGLAEPAAQAEVAKMRHHLSTKMGEVERWPLFDLVAQRLGEERIHFHTRFETFLMDGEGRGHVIYQMLRLFEEPACDLPAVRCSFRDFTLTWQSFQKSQLYLRSREYWLERLPQMPRAPELPLAQGLDPRRQVRFSRQQAKLLETEVWQRLKQRIARTGLTPSAVVIAAFGEIIARWSRNPSFTLGTIGTYRPPIHPDIHKLVANFNTISLLEIDRSAPTFVARAGQIQKRIAADLEHPYFSGFEVLREVNRRRGLSPRATVPVLLNCVVEYNHPSYRKEKSERLAECEVGTIRYLDLCMYMPQSLLMTSVGEAPDGWLWARWQSARGLLAEGLVEEMREAYERMLLGLADHEEPWQDPSLALPPENRRPPQISTGRARGALNRILEAETGTRAATAVLPERPAANPVLGRRESELAQVWEEVLGRRPERASDDFFALGADSLAAVRLARRVKERFHYDLPPDVLFRCGMLQTMARFLEDSDRYT
jgi:acyl carrier protein